MWYGKLSHFIFLEAQTLFIHSLTPGEGSSNNTRGNLCISISNAPVTLFTNSQPIAASSSSLLLFPPPSMRVAVSLTLPPRLTVYVKHTVMTTTYCKKKSLPIFIISSNYSTRCFINPRPLPPTLTHRTTNPQHGQLHNCGHN